MKKQILWVALLLAAVTAQAQYTASTQTNNINGTTTSWPGIYMIGSNTWHHDVLIIQSAGKLTNTTGYLGYGAANSNNLALITGAGSIWSNDANLYVGFSGAANTLIVTNGGTVYDAGGYLGYNATASNNVPLVTGAGSVWDQKAAEFDVGWYGAGNTVTITNGGKMISGVTYLGQNAGANSNTMLVTGGGTAEQYFQIQYDYAAADSDGLGNDIALTLTTIPEPGALGLGALALGGTYLLRRRVHGKKKRWNS